MVTLLPAHPVGWLGGILSFQVHVVIVGFPGGNSLLLLIKTSTMTEARTSERRSKIFQLGSTSTSQFSNHNVGKQQFVKYAVKSLPGKVQELGVFAYSHFTKPWRNSHGEGSPINTGFFVHYHPMELVNANPDEVQAYVFLKKMIFVGL